MSRVRIVGGQWRSRLISVPEATGLRPTPDRVRETLFNWLGQDLGGLRCLDLFAGSGALGFEAASRGAAEVVIVERVSRVFAHLKQAQATLGGANIRLVQRDALDFLRDAAGGQPFDVVFLDPPYNQGWLARLEPLLRPLLAEDARVYVEAEAPVEALAGLVSIKRGTAGQVHYQLLADTTLEPQ